MPELLVLKEHQLLQVLLRLAQQMPLGCKLQWLQGLLLELLLELQGQMHQWQLADWCAQRQQQLQGPLLELQGQMHQWQWADWWVQGQQWL